MPSALAPDVHGEGTYTLYRCDITARTATRTVSWCAAAPFSSHSPVPNRGALQPQALRTVAPAAGNPVAHMRAAYAAAQARPQALLALPRPPRDAVRSPCRQALQAPRVAGGGGRAAARAADEDLRREQLRAIRGGGAARQAAQLPSDGGGPPRRPPTDVRTCPGPALCVICAAAAPAANPHASAAAWCPLAVSYRSSCASQRRFSPQTHPNRHAR